MDVITSHLNADFDSLASMVAAKKLYPDAVMAFSGSQEKDVRAFLEQSTHTFSFERQRNIPLDQVMRLIVVDTRQSNRLGGFAQCLENPGIEVHIYDHHPDTPGNLQGQMEVIQQVGSTTTLFAQIFQRDNITISPEEATLMATAIHEDTGFFTFDTTTPEDLIAMAWLLEKGADLHIASQYLSQELTTLDVTHLHALIKSATPYTINGTKVVVTKLALSEYVDEFALLVRRFMDMENLDNLLALASMAGRVYLIARSRIPELNVGKLAREFGGGGHASAASATIKDMTLIEAEEHLLQLLHEHVRPESRAGELMSSPVISVEPSMPIAEANKLLTRYNITVLPVLKDKKNIKGTISRRVMEKSIHLGLGDKPVSDYMTTDYATLPTNATLAEIQQLIIENRQRFIPVLDDDIVKGVITRTDLLNILVNSPANLPKNLLDSQKSPSSVRHRNLNHMMVESLPKDRMLLLKTIGEVAKELGFAAFVVGGFVRDLLLRVKNLDFDIVVEGDGILFAKKLANELGGTIRAHEKFRTALVKLPDGLKIDVATARLEYYEYPAALPTVELSSIKLDLYRRDFTINAMAIYLNPEKFGTLVDFFNCQNDIKDRQLRILHNLSFVEDPTRIFRAIRFEQRMGFQIGTHTQKLIKNAVAMKLFDRFSGRRFLSEIRYLLSEKDPLQSIQRLAHFGLLTILSPKLTLDPRQQHILEETHRALSWHKLLYLDEPCEQWMVYFLALWVRHSPKEFKAFCELVEMSERKMSFLVREKVEIHRVNYALQRMSKPRTSVIYRLLGELSHEGLLCLMGISRKKSSKKFISLFVTHLRHVKTEIHGNELREMGYPTGPSYQVILNHLLVAKLDNIVHDRADEEKFLAKHFPLDIVRQGKGHLPPGVPKGLRN